LAGYDYAGDWPVHLTMCAATGSPFADADVATMVCRVLEETTTGSGYRLYGYCLMPDHLHVLVSPGETRMDIAAFLRRFKSFTTRVVQRRGRVRLWQRSAHDRVLRPAEDPMTVATYIANNPVRAGLVACWEAWPYARVFCE
jgi:REP element-mobilizing transposase RayT